MLQRGDLYLADLSNNVGSEQSGIRPVVITQNNIGNKYSPTIIVAPLTSQSKKEIDTHVVLTPDDCDIMKKSIILCEQLRAIDRTRLKRKLGMIHNQEKILELNKKLMISIGVINERNN